MIKTDRSRSARAKVIRIIPMLGLIEQDDHGWWQARTFSEIELGTYPTRAEASEALLVHAVFSA